MPNKEIHFHGHVILLPHLSCVTSVTCHILWDVSRIRFSIYSKYFPRSHDTSNVDCDCGIQNLDLPFLYLVWFMRYFRNKLAHIRKHTFPRSCEN